MSYKGFKKVSSDDKSTLLIHPAGHQLKIAHAGLSSKLRSDLKKIPVREVPKMASGGQVKKYSQAGEVTPTVQGDQETDNSTSSIPDSPVQIYVNGGQGAESAPPQMPQAQPAEQSQDQKDLDFYSSHASESPYYAQRAKELGAKLSPAPAGPSPASVPDQSQPAAQAPVAQPVPPQPNQAPAAPVQNAASQSDSSASPVQQPAAQTPEISPPDQSGQNADYQNSFAAAKQAHQQEFAQQDVAFQQDLANGHITPENYHDLMAKKDTLGKIGTIFGVMLGGIGSGLTGQPNAALTAMNNEISNDLQAQIHSKENAKNFLQLNQQQQMQEANIAQLQRTGALTDAQAKNMNAEAKMKAFTASQLQMNRVALHNQAQAVAKMPEGPQKEQAKQALAMMGTAVTNENANIGDIAASKMALLSTLGGGGSAMGLRVGGMKDLAEDVEKKTLPGVPGVAQKEIPDETSKAFYAQQQYDQKAKEYVAFAKQHANNWANLSLAQRQAIANQGAAMGANLQGLYRNKTKGGVYKSGEQEFIQQIIPDQPAKWSASFNAIPKVQQTIDDNQSDIQNTLGSVGLKMPNQQSGMVSVISPNGQSGSIPAANLQKALSRGYKAAQ
jgi:hypothetical protein